MTALNHSPIQYALIACIRFLRQPRGIGLLKRTVKKSASRPFAAAFRSYPLYYSIDSAGLQVNVFHFLLFFVFFSAGMDPRPPYIRFLFCRSSLVRASPEAPRTPEAFYLLFRVQSLPVKVGG
jgi:hypothetical protein